MFPEDLMREGDAFLSLMREQGLTLVTAESCTGGLIAGLLTEFPGSSDVVERGFVTYSNDAKREILGVPATTLASHGAVSPETAEAMAQGALAASRADLAIAVTGIAGPGGGSEEKPVGLVYVAVAWRGGGAADAECRFGDIGRAEIRTATVRTALALAGRLVGGQRGCG